MKKKVIILSGIKWNDTLQRHQMLAKWFSEYGYEVIFVEGIMSSSFSLRKLWRRLKKDRGDRKNIKNNTGDIRVYTSPLINPNRGVFEVYNKYKIRKMLKEIPCSCELVVSYLPIRTANEILNHINFKALIYYCVRAFENWGGYPKDLLKQESELSRNANRIWVDSFYLKKKFIDMGYENKLYQLFWEFCLYFFVILKIIEIYG